ncbi:MAG: hypothetical protein CMJ20_03790 [Phycisphaeraceae bacterium]|nr:hypothetical protein [Phycisphaeraceae bacterium]
MHLTARRQAEEMEISMLLAAFLTFFCIGPLQGPADNLGINILAEHGSSPVWPCHKNPLKDQVICTSSTHCKTP